MTSGCATQPSLYQSWGNQLASAAGKNLTKADISLMLGTEPNKCENASANPMIGIQLEESSGPTVRGVDPNGAAASTDIRIGDKIISVNSKATNSAKEVAEYIGAIASPDRPITIETQRGSYVLTPKYPVEAKQCYWEITAGQIGKAGGSAYVNQYGGSAVQGSALYERFFRATCRFTDGRVSVCQSNWQE
jgi:membrane-associated protease RseP (regulator of RpoE activity)